MPGIAPEELGRLYREHAPALRLYVRQLLAGDEDLVQDAFVRLAEQSPVPEQVLAWLYRVVRNGALAAGRGAARRRRRQQKASALASRLSERAPTHSASPAPVVVVRESSYEPSPGDYLSTRRLMEQDPNGWLALVQPAGLKANVPPPPQPAILTPRQRDGPFVL